MHRRWLVLVLALGATLAGGVNSSRGETPEAEAARHYGAGVHAYHQGAYDKAVRELDVASGLAPSDARIFLIRGAAKMRLGRVDDAKSDFLYGANVELASRQRDVGVALERIQGHDRLVMESYRRQARAAANAVQEAQRAQAKPRDEAKAQAAATGKPANKKPTPQPPTSDAPREKPRDEDQSEAIDDPFASDTDDDAGDEPADSDTAPEDASADETVDDAGVDEAGDEGADENADEGDVEEVEEDSKPSPARPRVSSFRINNLPPDASDPFADDAQNTLGRGAIEEAKEPAGIADDEPSTQAAGEGRSGGKPAGKPGDDGDEALEEFAAPADAGGDANKTEGGSAVGAAFRALMRSVAPIDALRKQGARLVPGAMPAGPVPGGPVPGGPVPGNAPSGMSTGGFDSMPDTDNDPSAAGPDSGADAERDSAEPSGDAFDEEDPFSSDAPAEDADAPADDSTEDADDDPFGS